MSLGAVGQPRRNARRSIPHREHAKRRRRELHDVRHPMRPELRIERVLVCPSGIHVVTSLAAPAVGAVDEIAPPSVVAAGHTAADLVAAVLPRRYRNRVRPVVCRLDEVAMAELVDDVLVTSPSTLEHIVAASPVVLSTSEVNDVALRLAARLEAFPVPTPARRRRWDRRHSTAVALVAGSVAAAGVALAERVGALPLPW
ncbi:MAG TPA: hypothetical protein VF165_19355 [Nocardioidaceae bacterium]